MPRKGARRPAKGFVFIATSLDGYIARADGDLGWLPEGGGTEDYGHAAFLRRIDALVMGRATFDKVLSFGEWPAWGKPVVVLTHRPIRLPPNLATSVETMSGSPESIAKALGARGYRRLYVDGGKTIQRFLDAGLIEEITITRVPVVLGEGIALFGAVRADIELKHLATKAYKGGLVQSRYRVARKR